MFGDPTHIANTTYDRGTSTHNGVRSHTGDISTIILLDISKPPLKRTKFSFSLIRPYHGRITQCASSTATAWHPGATKVTSFAMQAKSMLFMDSTFRDTTPPWFNMWLRDGKIRQSPLPQPRLLGYPMCRPVRGLLHPLRPLTQLPGLLHWNGLYFFFPLDFSFV